MGARGLLGEGELGNGYWSTDCYCLGVEFWVQNKTTTEEPMFFHWSSRASCCAVCCCTFVVLLERCCTCHRCDLTAVTVRDFNEVMKNRGKVGLPLQSGVLYLDSCGGPTVVLNTELDLPYNASIDDNFDSIHPEHRRAHTAFLAQPVRNSFLVFPSKYMHGVLPRLEADQLYARRSLHSSSCMRTTFLINWWGNDLAMI